MGIASSAANLVGRGPEFKSHTTRVFLSYQCANLDFVKNRGFHGVLPRSQSLDELVSSCIITSLCALLKVSVCECFSALYMCTSVCLAPTSVGEEEHLKMTYNSVLRELRWKISSAIGLSHVVRP